MSAALPLSTFDSVSPEAVGIYVLIMMALGHFVFAWLRHRRDEQSNVEPRHTPGVDSKIELRVKSTEERFNKEIQHVHGRISGLREEIRHDLVANSAKVEAAATDMRTMYTATIERIGDLKSDVNATMAGTKRDVAHLNQKLCATSDKIDRHIEKAQS